MRRSLARRAPSFVVVALFAPTLLLGCPSKPAAVQDAGPSLVASSPPPASSPSVVELAPLVEDAGSDADAAADVEVPKKRSVSTITANQAKIKVCCNAMHAQAKQLGTSPEGYQLETMATQCDVFAAQVGPQGSAPELNQFREILKTLKLPSACQL